MSKLSNRYYHTSESVDEYIHLSEGIDGSDLISKLHAHLTPDATVLEIGSGPGKDWEILQRTYNTTGSDNSQDFLSHLRSKFPLGSFLDLNATTLATDKTFDAIYSNKVLHHLTSDELLVSIERQAAILNHNGIICHSFWEGEGSEEFKGMYVRYHTKSELKAQFEDRFEILHLDAYKEFDPEDSLLLIAKKR